MSDSTPDDQALLERAREGVEASADDQARVKRKLFTHIGIGIGASTVATSGGAAAGTGFLGSTAKVLVALALGAGAGTSVVVAYHAKGANELHPVSHAAPVATAPSPSPAVDTSSPTSAPPSTEQSREESIERPTPRAESQGRAPRPTTFALPPATEPGSAATPAENTPPPAPFAALAPAAPGGPSTVGAETDLLRQAGDAAKAGRPAIALALLQEHATRFPNGILSEEREAERIVVLCALGRTEDARVAASQFLREHPRSPLARRVRESCGGT